MDRRTALKTLGLVPAFVLQGRAGGQDSSLSRLTAPEWAGRPQDRVTPFDNNPDIVAVEQKLRCTCGCNLSVYTCRTTDFTCTTSPAMHQTVIRLYQQRQTAEQILAAFVAKDGETVLMAPPKVGFNLAAYFVPGSLIALVGAAMLYFFYARRGRMAPATGISLADAGISQSDAQRLADELKHLEG